MPHQKDKLKIPRVENTKSGDVSRNVKTKTEKLQNENRKETNTLVTKSG